MLPGKQEGGALDVLHASAAAACAEKGQFGGRGAGEVETTVTNLKIRESVAVFFKQLRQTLKEEAAHQPAEDIVALKVCVPP